VELRRLGASDLQITPIGLGTWAIGGGDWFLGWGPQDDDQSVATIRRAVASGINWIDTAAVFGLGHAERVVAKALRVFRGPDRPYVFTRCGLVWDDLGNVGHDLGRESIRLQAEASLRRLGAEVIDLYQIGWPVWPVKPSGTAPPPASLEETWNAMAELQRQGKVRFIGISNCAGSLLDRLERIAPVTSLSMPYSLLRREAEDRADPSCMKHDIGLLVCSTLGSGLLTGDMTATRVMSLPHNDWRRRHPFFQEIALTRAATLVNRLRVVADRHHLTPAAVATAWTLRHPRVTAAIVGARRPQQIADVLQAASSRLSAQDFAMLTASHKEQDSKEMEPVNVAKI
jgi:aryl-alcohol dehydrogenase-like predicted oxidoreductase